MFIVTNNNNIVSYYVLNHELCTVLSSSHVIFIQSSKMDTVIVAVWWIKWSGGEERTEGPTVQFISVT